MAATMAALDSEGETVVKSDALKNVIRAVLKLKRGHQLFFQCLCISNA